MKLINDHIFSILNLSLSIIVASFALGIGVANASSMTTSTNKLLQIQTRADNEISQRLSTLNSLNTQISGSSKLNSADRTSLTDEISSEVSGLTTLKTKISADTTADQASTDESTIFTDYRVYAVIVPKVELLTIADNQQNNEAKLSNVSGSLEANISDDQTDGRVVPSSVQTELDTMEGLISSARTISSTIESDISPIIPSSWNSNHNVFSGDRSQLNTAYQDNTMASKDAVIISNSLKSIKS
jgi:hypothetical protein